MGSIFGPKNGVSHRRISLLPAHVVQADLRPCRLEHECQLIPFSLCASQVRLLLYKKQSGTQREKKPVLTLTLMLVRRKSACKTSAGSSKILRWLTPLLGPNLDPKTGPKQRPKRRNENVIQFWTPFWGPYLDPKMGSAIGDFRCCPAHVVQADLRPCSLNLNMNVNSYLFLFVRPKSGCYWKRPTEWTLSEP